MKVHISKLNYTCPHCSIGFSTLTSLWAHDKVHRPGNKPLLEPEDRQGIVAKPVVKESPSKLALAMKAAEVVLDCKKCGKRVRQVSYESHMNLHMGKRPFKCPVCPKAYPARRTLHRHMKCHKLEGGVQAGHSTASIEPTDLEPTDPEATEPVPTDPVPTDPVSTDSVPADPVPTDPVSTDPVLTDPVLTEMVVSIPVQVSVLSHGGWKEAPDGKLSVQSLPAVPLKSTSSANSTTDSTANRANGAKPFPCSFCDREYDYKKSLNQHIKLKHGNVRPAIRNVDSDKPFSCSLCDKKYTTKKSLDQHIRLKHSKATHNSDKPFTCPFCGGAYASKRSLKEHLQLKHCKPTRTVDNIKPFSCSLCDGVYATKKYLKSHVRRMHGSMGKSKSASLLTGRSTNRIIKQSHSSGGKAHTSKVTAAPAPLRSQGTSTGTREPTSGEASSKPCYPCSVCDHVLESLDEYKAHLYQHSNRSRFQCVACGRVYPNACKLWLHQRRTHKHFKRTTRQVPTQTTATVSERQPCVCSVCCRSYKSQSKLDAHMKMSHGPCPKCGSILSDMLHYKAHVKEHLRRRTFRCQRCSKRFYSTKSLNGHSCVVSSVMGQSKGKQVAACKSKKGVSSPSQSTMPQDPATMTVQPLIVQRADGSGRGYKCVFCGRVLSRMDHFTSHMNRHTGARPYTCEKCGMSFAHSAQKHRHCIKEHSSQRRAFPPKHNQTAKKQVTMSGLRKNRHTTSSENKIKKVAIVRPTDGKPKPTLDTQPLPGVEKLECGSPTLEPVDVAHRSGPSLSCGICGVTMQRYDSYMAHMTQHGMQSSKSSPTVATFRKHKKSAHSHHTQYQHGSSAGNKTDTGRRKFACTECGRLYKRKSDLTRHRHQYHPQPRLAATDMEVRGKEHLPSSRPEAPEAMQCEGTVESETERRKFACTECGRLYTRQGDLTRHRHRYHPQPQLPATDMEVSGKKRLPSLHPEAMQCEGTVESESGAEVNTGCDVEMGVEVECGTHDDGGVVPESLESPHDGKRVSECEVLPVCGEVQVGGREAEEGHTNPHSDTVFMKYGSWNVFFFADNTVS